MPCRYPVAALGKQPTRGRWDFNIMGMVVKKKCL